MIFELLRGNLFAQLQCQNTRTLYRIKTVILLGIIHLTYHSCSRDSNFSAPEKLFKEIPASTTNLHFRNDIEESDSFNIIQYLYYYNGGGVAVGDINNDGYPDIYFSANQNTNKLYLNNGIDQHGQITFTEISSQAGLQEIGNWSTGVSFVDINADGWLDIYLCQVGGYKNFRGRNQLFINQGCQTNDNCIPTFKEEAEHYGLDHEGFSTQAAFIDYDLDGDLDLYLLSHSVHSTESYRDTSFTRQRDPLLGDKLFRNNANQVSEKALKFEDVSLKAGIKGGRAGYGLGVGVGDIDNNGFPDLYISNDFHENDFLYLNQGDGTFREVGEVTLGHTSYFSMGNDVIDINNDGLLDIITLDMKPASEFLFKSAQGPDSYDIYRFKRSFGYHHQYPNNMLQINLGNNNDHIPRFAEVANLHGIAATDWSWSPVVADLDLDGWKDIYITNGIARRPNDLDYLQFISSQKIQEEEPDLALVQEMPIGTAENIFIHNKQGKLTISQEYFGQQKPTLSHGSVAADFDLDGDLDLVVNNLNGFCSFFQNQSIQIKAPNYIAIKLKGPPDNPFGVGTEVKVFAGHQMQVQQMYAVRGWQSSGPYQLHFGLDTTTIIDSLIVCWPDLSQQILKDVLTNQILQLDYSPDIDSFEQQPIPQAVVHTNQKVQVLPPFHHQEDIYYDNNREPLIPFLLSTQGPRLAIADVNQDGRLDFYIGGAKDQVGKLYLQQGENTFTWHEVEAFDLDAASEDVGCKFIDIDGDGDEDLFVGSAGNQYRKHRSLRDRLYLNDGAGNFVKSEGQLPDYFSQTACITPCDFDEDGDEDIFIGNLSVSLNYGKPADSYLLINDGKGTFSLAQKSQIDLTDLGMVTDAKWLDVDRDNDQDLLVIGHWMAPTVFQNHDDVFTKSTLNVVEGDELGIYGWWQRVEASDLDGDGDLDLVLGNFGNNSNLQPSRNEPIRLYLADFDSNLTPDPVLSYYRNGIEFPFLGLDQLGAQLNFLKKKFRSHRTFASKSLSEVFEPAQLEAAQIYVADNFHSCTALNDGQGGFALKALPLKAQITTNFAILIEDFNSDEIPDLVLAGNMYDLSPAIGRQDASYGVLLLGNGDGQFYPDDSDRLASLSGQVRDLKIVKMVNQDLVLAAKNNQALQTLSIHIDE